MRSSISALPYLFILGAIIVGGTNQVVVTGNVCDGQGLPHATVGIVVANSTNVMLTANLLSNVKRYGINIATNPVAGIHITSDNNFQNIPTPINHQDSVPGGLYDLQGTDTPEGVVVAGPGFTYRDTGGGQLYIKQEGTAATGWKLVQVQP